MEEEEKKRRKIMDSEGLETIALAVVASFFISGLKAFLPSVFRRWPDTFPATAPPHLLFLLLHLTVASLVLVSIHQNLPLPANRGKRKKSSVKVNNIWEEREEEEEEGDAEELNAKVEAFIQEFRQQLRIESLTSSNL